MFYVQVTTMEEESAKHILLFVYSFQLKSLQLLCVVWFSNLIRMNIVDISGRKTREK
jgi:hypothetical protein